LSLWNAKVASFEEYSAVLLHLYTTKKYSYQFYLLCVLSICNVQLTRFIIVFSSNEWVDLTRAGWCVVCGRLSGKHPTASNELFFTRQCGNIIQVKLASLQFSDVKFSQDSLHQKLLRSIHFCGVIQNITGGGAFWDSVDRTCPTVCGLYNSDNDNPVNQVCRPDIGPSTTTGGMWWALAEWGRSRWAAI